MTMPAQRRRWRAGARAVALGLLAIVPYGAAAQGVYESFPVKDREEQLLKSSRDFETFAERRGYLYRDPELEALVTGIGRQLAPEPTDDYLNYRVHLFRSPHPNAFALPDGQVYIHTGMLAILENEAQLATLIGHELNHAAGHHSIRFYRGTRKKLIAGTVIGSVIGVVGGDFAAFGQLLTSYAVVQAILGYSRDLEEEADRRAISKVAESGFDVRESPKLFEILARDPEGERLTVKTKWSTHPQLLERAAYLRQMAASIGSGTDLDRFEIGDETYRPLRWRVALDTVNDYIHADYPRSAVALATHLVEGDRANLTRDERDARLLGTAAGEAKLEENLLNAKQAYVRALDLQPDYAEARRGLGLVLFDLGMTRLAGRELIAYLKARPEAPDKPMIMERLREIKESLEEEKKQ
jgi:predicted Zn-dependent protease